MENSYLLQLLSRSSWSHIILCIIAGYGIVTLFFNKFGKMSDTERKTYSEYLEKLHAEDKKQILKNNQNNKVKCECHNCNC